jgi:hypothetical protein
MLEILILETLYPVDFVFLVGVEFRLRGKSLQRRFPQQRIIATRFFFPVTIRFNLIAISSLYVSKKTQLFERRLGVLAANVISDNTTC